MSSRGRSPSPRSITSSARGKKESHLADVDVRMDRSVSRGRDGKGAAKSQSRSRSAGRKRSKSNASMRSDSRSRSRSRSPARSRNRSIPPPRISNDSRDPQPAGRGPAWRVVIVSGLTKNVRREHLEEIFGKYGRITGVDLPIFAKSGQNRGKAAIEYINAAAAEKARDHMDQGQLDGSVLTVVLSDLPLPAPERHQERDRPREMDNRLAPVLPVDDLAMEETGMILETGTAETVQDLAPMTDDDGRIPDLALRHLVAAFPYEVDEIPDHPFADPAAAVAPLLGPGAEADQHGRTRHIPDLPRDQGPGHLLPDQSLALDRVHEVLGEGVTPEVQLGNPK
ncbi:hypothetical protein QFC24_002617 [Naganishia onofrii]|uniref:Uncharacterized protein n=1 Tax=Naganishia onofrii TaxID=1851511 RepID=A0ACC2XPQ5_9TREE|nr:hypothetical protein QFC24_002617 [Naganishia onofrii]